LALPISVVRMPATTSMARTVRRTAGRAPPVTLSAVSELEWSETLLPCFGWPFSGHSAFERKDHRSPPGSGGAAHNRKRLC
jgi:hypothetical protein